MRTGVPGSGTGQDGSVQQAEGQRAGPAHRQDDGVQGGQDVALCVVGLQGLGQLGQRGHILHRGTATCINREVTSQGNAFSWFIKVTNTSSSDRLVGKNGGIMH